MRKILIYILLIVGVGGVVVPQRALCQTPAQQSGARMTFEVVSHDFGVFVKGGESKSFDFEFTNTGDAPLVLVRAKSSCRCIEVEFPKRPVAPGSKGKVVVRYVPKDAGVFNKGIELFANIPGGSLTLFVKGNVQ